MSSLRLKSRELAKLEDICDAAGELFDKHFLKQPSTFAIIFNRKYNSEMNRDEIIKQLAELVHLKNMGNKVNLKTPEKTIICEVLKGMCMLTVVPDYFKLKKFNLHELGKKDEKKEDDEETQRNSVKKEEEELNDTKSTQEVPSANGDEKTEDDDKIKEESKE
jgi:tRNA acetyltransferase TAN1